MKSAIEQLIQEYEDLRSCRTVIQQAEDELTKCFQSGGKLLVCGNGGSAADGEHIVGELMKGFMFHRSVPSSLGNKFIDMFGDEGQDLARKLERGLPTISLSSQAGLITAISNDTDPLMVFAQQVFVYGQRDDVLLCISTSGNSSNVLKAAQVAKLLGLSVICLTGDSGGRLKNLCDISICVPYSNTYIVQEKHLAIYHALCMQLERDFFGTSMT